MTVNKYKSVMIKEVDKVEWHRFKTVCDLKTINIGEMFNKMVKQFNDHHLNKNETNETTTPSE